MKRILVINLGWEQEPLLDTLSNYEVEIYGVHYDNNYYKKPSYKDLLIIDIRDLQTILTYAKEQQVEAVISDQCDYSYFVQALIAENLNLPGPTIQEAQIATNKYLQRVKAKEASVLIPEFTLVQSVKDIYNFAQAVSYPIIIKPIDNSGSFGVNKISQESDIKDAYTDALINSHSRLTIVEKFIDGEHITVDGYVFKDVGIKSLAIANKKLASFKDRQVSMEIQYPATFNSKLYEKILHINETVNQALQFKFGMLHTEYMVTTDEQVYLIESANRGGGVYTSEIIVPQVSGINIVEQFICDTLGIKKNLFKQPIQKNKTILKFFHFKPGKIHSINGLEELEKDKNVLKTKVALNKGDIISEITTDANRHGFIIANNKDIEIDELISQHIKVNYEE